MAIPWAQYVHFIGHTKPGRVYVVEVGGTIEGGFWVTIQLRDERRRTASNERR